MPGRTSGTRFVHSFVPALKETDGALGISKTPHPPSALSSNQCG